MSNLIQIKRSLTTATPASLANGELAYTANGDVLFVGSNGAVVPIGGKRVPGTLTANQALVANSTSGIDKIITSNAVITTLWANGSGGSNGQVLVTNGSAVYWGTGTSGANTQVQFNDSGVANATAGFTFNKVSNTLFIGNTVNSTNINATSIYVTSVNSASFTVGSDFIANSSGAFVTGTVNGATLSVGGSVVANAGGVYVSGVVNASAVTVGSDFRANSSGAFVTGTVNATTLSVGSSLTANSSKIAFTGANIVATSATADLQNVNISQNIAVTGNAEVTGNLSVNGNVILGDNSSDTINSAGSFANSLVPNANSTHNIGSNGLRWNLIYANDVHATSASYSGDVSIGGNLTVSGNVVTTNVQSVIISDPMIYLAGNNYTSDVVDIGFTANYNDGTNRHTGLIRHAADSRYYLFANTTQELDSAVTVNTADPTFALATLNTHLISGAISTNTSATRVTANSTHNVQITVNTAAIGTLTLTSPLAAIYGGSGQTTYATGDILTASNTTHLDKLSLGASGYVLQSNGTALVYDILDGGSF